MWQFDMLLRTVSMFYHHTWLTQSPRSTIIYSKILKSSISNVCSPLTPQRLFLLISKRQEMDCFLCKIYIRFSIEEIEQIKNLEVLHRVTLVFPVAQNSYFLFLLGWNLTSLKAFPFYLLIIRGE